MSESKVDPFPPKYILDSALKMFNTPLALVRPLTYAQMWLICGRSGSSPKYAMLE